MNDENSIEMLLKGIKNITSAPFNTPAVAEKQNHEKDKNTVSDNVFSRQINALTAAIPFLDSEYQKSIFIVVKFLEYKKFINDMPAISIQSNEKNNMENMYRMAAAMRMALNEDEKRSFDNFYRILVMRNFLGGQNGF
jgi:hypothetical protein